MIGEYRVVYEEDDLRGIYRRLRVIEAKLDQLLPKKKKIKVLRRPKTTIKKSNRNIDYWRDDHSL